MKIIFVNRFFHPDHSATSQMLSDLAFALAERGHAIAIVTSRLRYDDPSARLPARETIRGVEVRRIATSTFGRGNLAGRAVDYATFYLSAAGCLARWAAKDDIIVAKTDPPMLSVVTGPVARWKRARHVNWLQDIFPEVAEEIQGRPGLIGRVGYRILKRMRDRSLKASQCSIVLGDRMAEHVEGLGVPPEKIAIVPNWADGALVRPVEPAANPLRTAWGLAGAFVVGYSGNLGRAHEFDTMVEAIAATERADATHPPHLSGRMPIQWLFVGGGAQFEAMKAKSRTRGLTSVMFQPYQPRERLAESLSVPDVHLVSLRPALEGLIVPSKYYGIAAAGRPAIFIGDRDGEIGRILAVNGVGTTVSEGDGPALAEAVLAYRADPAASAADGRRARQLFEEKFDLGRALASWSKIIDSLERARGAAPGGPGTGRATV